MAYTDIDDPSVYFNTKIFTGDNSANNAVTGVGFQPDWIWFKNRNAANDHAIVDSVRGRKALSSNNTSEELTLNANKDFESFDSDGFTVDVVEQLNSFNKSGDSLVSWNWKAGTSFTNDASSTSVGSIDSAGSVNTDAGFSIISYTGTGSNGTIAHGLGVVPAWIIHKRKDDASGWVVWHKSIGTNITELNETGAAQGGSSYINGTVPTSSVFSVGTSGDINASGGTYIAYCFAEKKGYLKTGKWIGNGNNNGPFSFCGFKPAFILIKRTDTAKNWYINDNKRLGYNVNNPYLSPNITAAETGGTEIDILSNGFKIRASGTGHNQTGGTYIFMAIAENPFVTSTGVPATAR